MKPYSVVFLCLTYSIWQNILKTHACFCKLIVPFSSFLLDAEQHLFTLAELEGRFKGPVSFSPLLPHASGLLQGGFVSHPWNSLHTRTLGVWFYYLEKMPEMVPREEVAVGRKSFFSLLKRVCSLVWEEKSQIVCIWYICHRCSKTLQFVFRVTWMQVGFFFCFFFNL